MQYVEGGCLGILMKQKNSKALEDTMGHFILVKDGRKGRDFKLTLILESIVSCVLSVLCLSMTLVHKSVQTLLNSREMHNLLHSQTIQQKLMRNTEIHSTAEKKGTFIALLCQKVKYLV